MNDPSNDPKNPILSFLGTSFLFIVPAALIVMLGVVGIAFMGGSGLETKEKPAAEVAAAPAVVTSAPEEPSGGEKQEDATAEKPEVAAAEVASAEKTDGPDPALMKIGRASYMTCAACHGADGKGLKAGPMLMAPSLIGSEILLGDPDAAILIILKGIAKENMDYMGMMASLGAALNDEKLAGVLTYTRNTWGNSAPEITVEQVASARARFADVDAPAGVKRAEIEAIIKAHQ